MATRNMRYDPGAAGDRPADVVASDDTVWPPAYIPPLLEGLGTVWDRVAGGSGANSDGLLAQTV